MKPRHSAPLLAAAAAAVLAAAPALAQRDGTPGNPPSTMTGRAVDQMQGRPSVPDGTPGNPPGTAAERAADRALGTNMSGANPQGQTATTPAAPTTAPAATAPRTAGAEVARDGLRASKMVGANVYNEENERIGEVEDLLLSRGQMQPTTAVLSVGGFLGIGAKRVAVPFEQLQWNAERERWVLPGATRDSLRERPSFEYAEDRRGDTGTAARRDTTAPAGTAGTGVAPRGDAAGGGAATQPPAAPSR
jgi:sporulation protein YlmC with PRC-barrel domain